MNSWQTQRTAGRNQQMNPQLALPPLPGAGSQTSPRRREHVAQPPALTTSLGGIQSQGGVLGLASAYSATPRSTSSLSGPFSQTNPSPYAPSPGGAARGTSPMAGRLSSGYSAPYNPSEWGPVNGTSPNLGTGAFPQMRQASGTMRAASRDPDAPVASPPPPYSPRPTQRGSFSGASTNANLSPADLVSLGTVPSQYNTPVSAATTVSSDLSPGQRVGSSRPRPLSMISISDSPSASWTASFPPPPAASGRGSRSSSKTGVDRGHQLLGLAPFTGRNKPAIGPPQQNAVETLQQTTSESPRPLPKNSSIELCVRPQASKRAASTSAIATSSNVSRDTSRSGSRSPPRHTIWEPGMPLPPPPPGPPPNASRSQSASGLSESSSKHLLNPAPRPKNRQPPALGTSLEPVPPTPAGWYDEDLVVSPSKTNAPLHIDTTNVLRGASVVTIDEGESSTSISVSNPSTAGGLLRSSAVRDSSAQGIRERRSYSRPGKERNPDAPSGASSGSNLWSESVEIVTPADLILPTSGGTLSRRRIVTKSTIGSNSKDTLDDRPQSATSLDSMGVQMTDDSSRSTPRADSARYRITPRFLTQTPPFSPNGEPYSPTVSRDGSPALPPKALPTPPPQRYNDLVSSYVLASGGDDRPTNQDLRKSNDESAIPSLLNIDGAAVPSKAEGNFVHDAIERHREFIKAEQRADSADERLYLFSEYVIAESAIRRQRYAQVWNTGGFNEQKVRERLFQIPSKPPTAQSGLRESTTMLPIEPPSPASATDVPQMRLDSQWGNNYQPCLSPIASASMSNGHDELSSRGRTPSRWWESQTGSGSDGAARKVERSKRESKYMGLPRELREAMQEESARNPSGLGPSQAVEYGLNEYPPEKVGWHEQESAPTPPPPPAAPQHHRSGSTSQTEEPRKLDVSRLVTLPPPYPRHHPAVNNNHPDLTSYRTLVRAVSDLTEVSATKGRYRSRLQQTRDDSQKNTAENRRLFRTNLHSQIEEGSISYAEAAEAEGALKIEESQLERKRVMSDFEEFQNAVLKPLHELLSERLKKTTYYFDDLRSKLFDEGLQRDPNQTQEEGDEHPELLEKLTQLKWLFEAREQLHREVYELLSERNDRYKAIAVLPYRQSGDLEKVRGTEDFFYNDGQDRLVSFEAETLKRHEMFMDVIEENVTRGVEIQLSAFWDIAPPLLTILQSVPADLRAFAVQVPRNEYDENPIYHRYPLQYMYSLLSHAQRSTYQFIESQTNLLCLLHEAKTGVMIARCKLLEAQRLKSGDSEERVREEIKSVTRREEETLTADLKDKVATVEGQWTEALGSQLADTKRRVEDRLVQQGGWDVMEET